MQSEAEAKACCADLYQSDMARLIMGDTLHPGGLGLTNRLGRLMGLRSGDWVADLASARGESAQALARVFRCNVLGVEFGAEAVRNAQNISPESGRAHFVRGDAECLPLRSGAFDAAVCECSMSLFINKAQAVAETARLLRPGGRFGLSDVTIEPDSLPPELEGELGQVLCLTSALTADGYVDLLEEGGLSRSVNKIQRAITVRRLQRDHGTPYVQKLIEHISRRRAAQIRAGMKGNGVRDTDAGRMNSITEQMRLRN